MQAMNVRRPTGRVAVALAGVVSLACGWMALASTSGHAADDRAFAASESSAIMIDWEVADVLIEVGAMTIEAYHEDGGAVAVMAASGGTGPTVIVVGDDTVTPGSQPCLRPSVPGPGGKCLNGAWDLYDYPPQWKLKSCQILLPATQTAGAYVRCEYEYTFEFLRQVASTRCGGCPYGEVCVEYAQYTHTCTLDRWVPAANGCDCPAAPGDLPIGSGGWANGQSPCAPPTLPPSHPGVSPGGKLPGFVVTQGVRCYKPGRPW